MSICHLSLPRPGGLPTTIRYDLRDEDNWQPSTISAPIEKLGRECKAFIPSHDVKSNSRDSTAECGCVTKRYLGRYRVPFGSPCFCTFFTKKKVLECVSKNIPGVKLCPDCFQVIPQSHMMPFLWHQRFCLEEVHQTSRICWPLHL